MRKKAFTFVETIFILMILVILYSLVAPAIGNLTQWGVSRSQTYYSMIRIHLNDAQTQGTYQHELPICLFDKDLSAYFWYTVDLDEATQAYHVDALIESEEECSSASPPSVEVNTLTNADCQTFFRAFTSSLSTEVGLTTNYLWLVFVDTTLSTRCIFYENNTGYHFSYDFDSGLLTSPVLTSITLPS